MKHKKSKVPAKFPAATAAVPTLPPLLTGMVVPVSPPLGTLVSAFLSATSQLHPPAAHERYYVGLKHFAADFGHLRIAQVSDLQIKQIIISNQRWGSRSRREMRHVYKIFFHWARSKGYLPQHLPTAADLVNLNIKALPPQIILAPRLGQLLRSTRDPGILMPMTIFAFAGPLVAELERLGPGDLMPGHSILINQHQQANRRVVHMQPVLDAWLRPFYGYPDLPFLRPSAMRKFRQWARAQNLRLLPRHLRNSFIAHLLDQSGDPHRTALEAGLRVEFCHKFLTGLVASGSARNYFSFTPAKVGLTDWPRMVKEYQAQNSRQRRIKNP